MSAIALRESRFESYSPESASSLKSEPCFIRMVLGRSSLATHVALGAMLKVLMHLECRIFLCDLGYMTEGASERLVHSTAKIWLTNALSSLTTFPLQLGLQDLYRLVQDCGRSTWQRYSKEMTFLLPKSSTGGFSSKQTRRFGTRLARQILQGGGPIMLQDSTTMVAKALKQLGYLDADMNTDMFEAMLLFVNAHENQYALRKQLRLLPSPEDTATEVESKLRHATLLHCTDGQWRIAPRDTDVRKLFFKHGLLPDVHAARGAVFKAMIRYARQHQVSEMRTYNEYVFHILSARNRINTKTGIIELQP